MRIPWMSKHSLLLQYDFFSIKNPQEAVWTNAEHICTAGIFQFQMPHINRHLMLRAAMLPCCLLYNNNSCTGAFSSESLATFFPFRFTGLPWSGRSHDSWWDSGQSFEFATSAAPGPRCLWRHPRIYRCPKRPRILSSGWFRVVSIDLK